MVGFYYLRDYYVKCMDEEIEPFNGSYFKLVVMPLLCGYITGIILIFCVIKTVFDIVYQIYKIIMKYIKK